jgi:hypothetical protein
MKFLEHVKNPSVDLIAQLNKLREDIHTQMEEDVKKRLETNPNPTEDELRAAAFVEWIEPQARDAVREMNRKGYATKSSGFYGPDNSLQAIDGYFFVDHETKTRIEALGAEVLTGEGIGVPMNKLIRQIRFTPDSADAESIKARWNAIADLLPVRNEGPRAICDRAEEFREEYAPDHPSLQKDIEEYWDFIKRANSKTL